MSNPYLQPITTITSNLADILVFQATQWIIKLIAVVIIFVVGWLVAKVVKQIVVKLLQSTKVDQWVDEQNLTAAIGGREVSSIAGSLVKWWIVVIVLQQSLAVLQLDVLGGFLGALASWILAALVALVMLIIGLLLARYARNAVQATDHRYKRTAGIALEIVIIYLAVVLALRTVKVDVTILEDAFRIAFAAFALVVAIIVGVSFGLAFKEDAQKIVTEIRKLPKK